MAELVMKTRCSKSASKQKGAVLILLAMIVFLGVLAYMLRALNPEELLAAQNEKTYQSLNAAKQALIAWSVSHPNTPGLMPYPDRNGDGNYDDTSDCYAPNVNFSTLFTLGRLPLFRNDPNCINAATTATNGLSEDFRDAAGERFWYEVSENLLHDYKSSVPNPNGVSPLINPSIVNSPSQPWFVVRDRSGAIISDRVAAVIISPGAPLPNQDRSGGVASRTEYLDKIVMADNTPYQNYGYQDPGTNPIQEFIIGDDFRKVSKSDPTYKNQAVEPYYYNDKLIYITIDELMAALEKRVGEEARVALRNYATANGGNYPYAAVLGGVGSTRRYRCIANNLVGSLPVDNPADACTYAATGASVNISCNFQDVTSIQFRRSISINFTSNTLGCTFSGRTCTCTGAGSCTEGSNVFSCNASGNCSSTTLTGRVRFIGTGLSMSSSAICSLGAMSVCQNRTVTCNGSSSTVNMGYSCTEQINTLPAWFSANRWQDSVFYQLTRPTNILGINVGSKTTGATVITSGSNIINTPFAAKNSAQIRPSCAINDYLDSAENVDVDVPPVFEATSKLRASNYNDQTFVVSP